MAELGICQSCQGVHEGTWNQGLSGHVTDLELGRVCQGVWSLTAEVQSLSA